jgi:hypothetical protein
LPLLPTLPLLQLSKTVIDGIYKLWMPKMLFVKVGKSGKVGKAATRLAVLHFKGVPFLPVCG